MLKRIKDELNKTICNEKSKRRILIEYWRARDAREREIERVVEGMKEMDVERILECMDGCMTENKEIRKVAAEIERMEGIEEGEVIKLAKIIQCMDEKVNRCESGKFGCSTWNDYKRQAISIMNNFSPNNLEVYIKRLEAQEKKGQLTSKEEKNLKSWTALRKQMPEPNEGNDRRKSLQRWNELKMKVEKKKKRRLTRLNSWDTQKLIL